MAVPLTIRKHADNIAKTIEAMQAALASRTRLCTVDDAAGDETFEHRCDVTAMALADDAIESGAALFADTVVRSAINLLVTYCGTDLGLASPHLDTYLSTVLGCRVPYEFAEAYYEATGVRLLARNVFPTGTMVADTADPSSAGLHKFGTLTGTSGASVYASDAGDLDTTKIAAAAIVAIAREADITDVAATLGYLPLSGEAIEIAITPSESQYGQVVVGQQAITSVTGAVLGVAATAQFKVGEYVLLWENADGDTSLREVGIIKTDGIVENTSIELTAAPVNTFSASGYVIPMFKGVDDFVSGNIDDGDHLDFYALPDRIIAF